MSDRARRIANLSPEQRRILELRLQESRRARANEGIPALPRRSESNQPAVFPLSPAQRWSWFAEQCRPDMADFNVASASRLRGPLNVAALEASLREICVRHEGLHTTFGTRDGEPVQIVGPPRPVSLTRVDLREISPPVREAEVRRLLAQEAKQPFDLSGDLLLRATLLRLDDEEHVLLVVMHHIVSDGWSVEVLFRELSALYNASRSGGRASLPELPVQYVDYVVWQRLQDDEALRRSMEYWKKQLADTPKVTKLRRSKEYWKKRLANTPEVTKLPIEHPDPLVQTLGGAQQELRIPVSLVQKLHVLCSRQRVTLFMVLLAAWATLLHRYSGEDDILITTPTANRNRGEVEGLIGFFSNVLVLRQDLSADPSFAELLGRVRAFVFDALSHSELPFVKLREELHPSVQVKFSLLNAPQSSLKLDGLRVERIEMHHGPSAPFLTLRMIEGDNGLTAWLNYNTHLFEAITAARMLEHFRSLLENIVTDPEQHLSKLPLPIKEAGGSQTGFGKRLLRAVRRARRLLLRAVRRARRTAGELRARIKNGPFFG
jgi:hypothetical protein